MVATPVDDGKETEAIVTPLDVKPAEVQIVQESRQPRSAYYGGGYGGGYGGYGFKYSPVLSYYGYPRYYSPYYGKTPFLEGILTRL